MTDEVKPKLKVAAYYRVAMNRQAAMWFRWSIHPVRLEESGMGAGGQTSTSMRSERDGFTAVNMRYPALSTDRSAAIFTEGLHGTTGGNTP